MVKARLTLMLCMALTCTAPWAADVGSVVAGDVYYLWRLDRPNIRVTVREVDHRGQRVKVAYPNGEVRWVSASELKTREEAASADVAAGVGVVGAALLVCALSPETCRSKPTQPAPAAASAGSGTGGFLVTNKCRHPVRLAITYQPAGQSGWTTDGWWTVAGSSTTYLADGSNRRLYTTNSAWYYYAESTNDTNLVWKGDQNFQLGGNSLPMAKLVDTDGDSEWTLVCDGR